MSTTNSYDSQDISTLYYMLLNELEFFNSQVNKKISASDVTMSVAIYTLRDILDRSKMISTSDLTCTYGEEYDMFKLNGHLKESSMVVYNFLYHKPLKEVPMYLCTSLKIVAKWRLSIGK